MSAASAPPGVTSPNEFGAPVPPLDALLQDWRLQIAGDGQVAARDDDRLGAELGADAAVEVAARTDVHAARSAHGPGRELELAVGKALVAEAHRAGERVKAGLAAAQPVAHR